ncbi:MAG: hypothetical protein ACI9WU_004192 [Myxococcota bacterium]|jgi:hypothetical protein
MKMTMTMTTMALLTASLLLPLTAAASPPGDRGGQGERGKHSRMGKMTPEQRQVHLEGMRTRIKAKRAESLRGKAGLDEATALEVEGILETFDATRQALHTRKFEARRAMRRLLEADSSDMAAYDTLLDDQMAIQQGMHTLRTQQVAAIRAAVDAKTAASVLRTLQRLRRRMHRKMGRGGKWHGTRGERGGEGKAGKSCPHCPGGVNL